MNRIEADEVQIPMGGAVVVLHYHELWLKGRNRRFFLGQLVAALRQGLSGIPIERIEQPGDRLLVQLGCGASLEEAVARLKHIFGVAYYAVARAVERNLEAICDASWNELEALRFSTFAVRAKRSDKSFPHSSLEIECVVGRYLLERLRSAGRNARVQLDDPELTCWIEITPGPALVYARKIAGPGGLPANTAGRALCLLSGGFDSAVAAHQMMKRGAHLSFVHFFGAGARPGESSVHVAKELVRRLTPWQFSSKLYCVPFESVQREIVRYAPESYRVLLYRRMMLRIAEAMAQMERALALVTGDCLGQVASQTLHNLASVGEVTRLLVFRPLIGTDKLEILDRARKIGTYDISAEPFHDCCPVFLPRNPALHASPGELAAAEARLDIDTLVRRATSNSQLFRFRFTEGQVQEVDSLAELRELGANTATA